MGWTATLVSPPSTTPTTGPPPPTTVPTDQPGQAPRGPDWDALKHGDFSSVGGKNYTTTTEAGATTTTTPPPTTTSTTLPPSQGSQGPTEGQDLSAGASGGAVPPSPTPAAPEGPRLLDTVSNAIQPYVDATRARAGVPPPPPGTLPERAGQSIGEAAGNFLTDPFGAVGRTAGDVQTRLLPNAVGGALDVQGHPNYGTAAKYITLIAPFVMGGYSGAKQLYESAIAGDQTAVTAWRAAQAEMQAWRQAHGEFTASWDAARAAEAENAARATAAQQYRAGIEAENAARTAAATRYNTTELNTRLGPNEPPIQPHLQPVPNVTPTQVPVPERLPVPARPSVATRTLAMGPEPAPGPPSGPPFNRMLLTRLLPSLLQGAYRATQLGLLREIGRGLAQRTPPPE